MVEPVEGIPVQLFLLHEWRCESTSHMRFVFVSNNLKRVARKVKSRKCKIVTTLHFRSPSPSRVLVSGDVPTRVIFLKLCRKSAALPAVCARSSRAARAPHPPSPRNPHTATRPDRATRSPRPLDALSHRDHSTAHALSCSNRTRCHSVTRGGSQRQSETRRIRDARRHTRPWPRCRPHMHTTHAHHTCTPNRLSSLRGERHDVS